MKLTDEQIVKLENMGFNRWTKYGKDRLYASEEALGLKISRYNTGNISYAELDGEKISNTYARDLLNITAYIDVETGEIVAKGVPRYANTVISIIQDILDAV